MDRSMQLRHLEKAERHIAEGMRHIVEQELRIEKLAGYGADLTEARKLLDNFYAMQTAYCAP